MKATKQSNSFHRLSVIVPTNPFSPSDLQDRQHCLCALDVIKLMEWWPGTPHTPHRNPNKVCAIQRSLDWKRVVKIAAYLLQSEIIDAPEKLDKYFKEIYQPKKKEPGRQWPPKISKVVGYEKSEFPMFSNILLHVNGAKIEAVKIKGEKQEAANLVFDENSKDLNFQVIDGQHRINGAYLAIKLLQEKDPKAIWQIPSEIFLDLDLTNEPPRKQAQIFIDVNFYQKKVDRSLVADLFPTARGNRGSLDRRERSQDIGRKLMLEIGPLVGMIQIPGIKYGVKDVITLSTLNGAIEDSIKILVNHGIEGLKEQCEFIAQCLTSWFEASGRFENPKNATLNAQNVAYQGRVLVSVITLIPAMILELKEAKVIFISKKAKDILTKWLKNIASQANLLEKDIFISKDKFKDRGYLGSGGIGRFRDSLWAVINKKHKLNNKTKPETIHKWAEENRSTVIDSLEGVQRI